MVRSICFFLLILPFFCRGQVKSIVSFEEAIENCHQIAKEANVNPEKYVYTGPECLIGASIPEFTAFLLDGKEITQEYFKGKITVINFWYASCTPCIAEIPGLNAIVEKYGKSKVNYIAIAKDSDADVQDFLHRYPWNFDQVKGGNVLIFDVFKFGWGYPTTFVINRDGQIIYAFSGGRSDESAIDEIQVTLSSVLDKEIH